MWYFGMVWRALKREGITPSLHVQAMVLLLQPTRLLVFSATTHIQLIVYQYHWTYFYSPSIAICCCWCFFLPNPLHWFSDFKDTAGFVRAMFCSSPHWLLDLSITTFLMLCLDVAVDRVMPGASRSHLHYLLWCMHIEFTTCSCVARKTIKHTLMMKLCQRLWLWLRFCCYYCRWGVSCWGGMGQEEKKPCFFLLSDLGSKEGKGKWLI